MRRLKPGAARPWPLLALLLGGCAQLPWLGQPVPPAGGFEISARVAVRHQEEGFSGAVRWQHGEASDSLLILSPVGQALASIEGRPGQYELKTHDRREFVAADPEALTRHVLGWGLPVQGLAHWLRASPAPWGLWRVERDDQGRLTHLAQDGWDIEYLSYRPEPQSELPGRMRLSREGLDIRLSVDSWVLAPAQPAPAAQ